MSPAGYGMLKSQVEIVDKLIQHIRITRSEAQQLLDTALKTEVTHLLDEIYRLVYDGKSKLLSQMEHPCAVG